MAITYTLNVNRLGMSDSFSISATITDDTKPVGHQTESVSVLGGRFDTPENKQHVWDTIQAEYLRKIVESKFVSALETEGKSYLETL